jgi:hypothetical protein
MKDGRLLDVFTGIVLGALIGLFYPLEAYKAILVIVGVGGVLRLVTVK